MPCRRSTPRSQIWKRENDFCANRSVWIPGGFFVDIELGNLYLKRGSRENALQAYSGALQHAPNDPELRRSIEEQIKRVSAARLGQVLSYEIRLWSDVHEKGLWKGSWEIPLHQF